MLNSGWRTGDQAGRAMLGAGWITAGGGARGRREGRYQCGGVDTNSRGLSIEVPCWLEWEERRRHAGGCVWRADIGCRSADLPADEPLIYTFRRRPDKQGAFTSKRRGNGLRTLLTIESQSRFEQTTACDHAGLAYSWQSRPCAVATGAGTPLFCSGDLFLCRGESLCRRDHCGQNLLSCGPMRAWRLVVLPIWILIGDGHSVVERRLAHVGIS